MKTFKNHVKEMLINCTNKAEADRLIDKYYGNVVSKYPSLCVEFIAGEILTQRKFEG